MEDIVSIIVPVYNVESYLPQCVNSILNQSYTNFELILIDNYSTDNSFSICKEYEKKDNRIKVLQSKVKGVSSTRNVGLNYAKGMYVVFCDSDDLYDKNFLVRLIVEAKRNDADIIISNYAYLNTRSNLMCNRNSGVINTNELIRRIFIDNSIGGFVWNKMFKRSILSNVKFDEEIQICEDTLFVFEALKEAKKIFFVYDAVYLYRLRSTSAVASIDNVIAPDGSVKYISVYDMIINKGLVTHDAVARIKASEFALASGVKCDYAIAHQNHTEMDDAFYNKIGEVLKNNFSDFILSPDYSVKKKLVVISNALFNLRKRKQQFIRFQAHIKNYARNLIRIGKRTEFLITVVKSRNQKILANNSNNDIARNKLLDICPFPKGIVTANNNISNAIDLTIIVPAYNVETYIEQCMDSIVHQKTKYEYEVIIVNDGSTDGTQNIIHRYKSIDNIRIINRLNGGLSAARNSALEVSNGRYLMFVDSDDYILPCAIESLLDKAYKYDADIVEGSAFSFFEDGRISRFFKHRDSTASVSALDELYGYPWGKIVKSTMFRNIKFPEQFWFEDTLFAMIIYPKANIVHTVSDEVYAYRVNMKGITQSARNNPRAIESLWITECLIAEQKKQNLLSEGTYNQYFNQMAMNDSRVKELGMDVRLAVLNESFRILKYYYGNYKFKIYRMKARMLYRAIVKNDFTRAFVLMDYWNYI